MIDYTLILNSKYPNSAWTLNGDSYEGLTWLDKSNKPTQQELDLLWAEVQEEIRLKIESKEALKTDLLNRLGLTVEELSTLLA